VKEQLVKFESSMIFNESSKVGYQVTTDLFLMETRFLSFTLISMSI